MTKGNCAVQVTDLNCRQSLGKFWVIWLPVDEATTTWAILRYRGSLAEWQLQICERLNREFDRWRRLMNFCIVQHVFIFRGVGTE